MGQTSNGFIVVIPRRKYNTNGSIQTFKVRLVAKSFK